MAHALLWLFLYTTIAPVYSQAPVQVPFSSQTYGPDGPWHAVTVGLGTPPQNIDLFPGVSCESYVLGSQLCTNTTPSGVDCSQQNPRFFNSSNSATANLTYYDSVRGGLQFQDPIFSSGYWGLAQDVMSIPAVNGAPIAGNAALDLVNTGQMWTGSKQTRVPSNYELGMLSVGCPHTTYLYPNRSSQPIDAYPVNAASQNQSRLPSASFALHYGSVAANVPPSLILGGFDKSRAIGPPISLPFTDPLSPVLSIRDIYIGTAEGKSPWADQNVTLNGLLQRNASHPIKDGPSSGDISAYIRPGNPYLGLPDATCAAIAALLPVQFDADRETYYWMIGDPQYESIVSGASYLAFQFSQLKDQPDVSIKVPFKLLNLSLEGSASLGGPARPYFPCMGYGGTDYTLGRSFLQAAYFAANWMPVWPGRGPSPPDVATFMLAQAPGPNVGSPDIEALEAHDTALQPSSMTFEESWKGHWTPLQDSTKPSLPPEDTKSPESPQSSAAPNTSETPETSGISRGAQAGFGIAIVSGLALIGGLAWWITHRHRRCLQQPIRLDSNAASASYEMEEPATKYQMDDPRYRSELAVFTKDTTELDAREITELGTQRERVELDASHA